MTNLIEYKMSDALRTRMEFAAGTAANPADVAAQLHPVIVGEFAKTTSMLTLAALTAILEDSYNEKAAQVVVVPTFPKLAIKLVPVGVGAVWKSATTEYQEQVDAGHVEAL